jgi:hypothetical protein
MNRNTETFKPEFQVNDFIIPTVSFLGSNGGIIEKNEIVNLMKELNINTWRTKV